MEFQCASCKKIYAQLQVMCPACGELDFTQVDSKALLEKAAQQAEAKRVEKEARKAAAAESQQAYEDASEKQKVVKRWRNSAEAFSQSKNKLYRDSGFEGVLVLTLDLHPSRQIAEIIGPVSGVSGDNKGFLSLKSQQKVVEMAIWEAENELRVAALALGANAVLGARIVINSNNPGSSTLAGGGTSSTETVAIYGTAVRLQD